MLFTQLLNIILSRTAALLLSLSFLCVAGAPVQRLVFLTVLSGDGYDLVNEPARKTEGHYYLLLSTTINKPTFPASSTHLYLFLSDGCFPESLELRCLTRMTGAKACLKYIYCY